MSFPSCLSPFAPFTYSVNICQSNGKKNHLKEEHNDKVRREGEGQAKAERGEGENRLSCLAAASRAHSQLPSDCVIVYEERCLTRWDYTK